MQGQAQQRAYDRGITIFSPDGRLYQVEYAREAVKRGTVNIGVRTPEGAALTADRRSRSPLMEPTNVERIHKVDDHIGIASTGHIADARQLIDFARCQSQVSRLRYDGSIDIETLTKEVIDHIQQYTRVGGVCPLGAALLIGGVENGTPRLYETGPLGVPYEWKIVSIRVNRGDHQEYLEESFHDDLTLGEDIELMLEAIVSTSDEGTAPDGVDVTIVSAETEYFVELSNNEIGSYLEVSDLLAAEDDEQAEE